MTGSDNPWWYTGDAPTTFQKMLGDLESITWEDSLPDLELFEHQCILWSKEHADARTAELLFEHGVL